MTTLTQLITLATADPNVLAIGTEGASNDPSKPTDEWTDLDVTLFVREMAQADGNWWVHQLGTPTIVQHLVDSHLFGPATGTWESWLTRYPGTARVDLKLAPATDIAGYLAGDTLNTLVWQRTTPTSPRPTSAASHALKRPTQVALDACVTEFYWVAGYVVKGLARGNLVYANTLLDQNVRPELYRLLEWRATIARDGRFDPGANHKFLWATLTPGEQARLAASYAQTDLAATRASLGIVLALFQQCRAELVDYAPTPYQDSAAAQLASWLNNS
ncbi:aminoglycoside 6-adenylyltransferase [Lacticaseibacillus daqingensis]|uniref:aminoglycoside 6-adenylyltransferase n=1 Tax=Lacticaseibacillus daqingensis TaxID=2486014 RepID=UPI0013DD9CCB|nr:aminoglycoside 6-adenylyltransferase [Lacticaseibacillus daqingensis]